MSWVTALTLIGAVVGGFPGLVLLAAIARKLWRSTAGAKSSLARRLGALGTEVNLEYVYQLLGQNCLRRAHGSDLVELVWKFEYATVQMWLNSDTIVGYSVSALPCFHPVCQLPVVKSGRVVISKTTFKDLVSTPRKVFYAHGNHLWSYGETYSYGEAGLRQVWVLGLSGRPFAGHHPYHINTDGKPIREVLQDDYVRRLRETPITRYAVLSPKAPPDLISRALLGPSFDLLGLLSGCQPIPQSP